MSKVLKWILVILLVGYSVGCLALYMLQEQVIFDPHKIDESFKFGMGEEVELEVDDDIYLNVLHIKRPNPKGVIIYLHGNRGDNRRCLRQANSWAPSDHDLLMPDYRGYGKSDGEIEDQEQLLSDMQAVYDFAKANYKESSIVVVGYSLGTGMATYLGATNNPGAIGLVAPYVSFCDLKDRYAWFVPDALVKYPLHSDRYIQSIKCPVTMFHGTEDEVIPYDSAEKLLTLSDKVELVTLDGVGHRRAIFDEAVRRWAAGL